MRARLGRGERIFQNRRSLLRSRQRHALFAQVCPLRLGRRRPGAQAQGNIPIGLQGQHGLDRVTGSVFAALQLGLGHLDHQAADVEGLGPARGLVRQIGRGEGPRYAVTAAEGVSRHGEINAGAAADGDRLALAEALGRQTARFAHREQGMDRIAGRVDLLVQASR